MPKDIEDSLKTILHTHSSSEGISEEFENSLIDRFKKLLYTFGEAVNVDQYLHLNRVVRTAIFLIASLGGIIGFITTYYSQDWPVTSLYMIWIVYSISAAIVFVISQFLPQSLELFDGNVRKLKLVNLCEILNRFRRADVRSRPRD